MNPSSFYGDIEQGDSDEDFIPSNVSESSSSKESDESGDTEDNGTDVAERETEDDEADETGETDDFTPGSNVAPVQGWGPVSSTQRCYAFTGKEELVIMPQVNSITGKPEPSDMYELFITDALLNTIVTETNIYLVLFKGVTAIMSIFFWLAIDTNSYSKVDYIAFCLIYRFFLSIYMFSMSYFQFYVEYCIFPYDFLLLLMKLNSISCSGVSTYYIGNKFGYILMCINFHLFISFPIV